MPPTERRPTRPHARPTGKPHARPRAGNPDKARDRTQDGPQGTQRDTRQGARRPARPHGAPRNATERPAASPGRAGFNPTDRGTTDHPAARPGTRAAARPNTRSGAQPGARHNAPAGRAPQAKAPGARGPRNGGNTRPRSGGAAPHGRHDRPGRAAAAHVAPDTLTPPAPPRPVPTEPLPVLYQDRHVVIVNKPAGLPVHAGPRGGLCVEDWFPQLSRRADGPWLVHRLDADTAGCLAIALRKQPLVAMQQAFANHTARKTYWAIVRNGPKEETGRIDLPLVRENTPTGWHMRPDPKSAGAGKNAATTLWRVLGRGKDLCWLELTLLSGRTHQARVHCAAMGWPIVGDSLYGTADARGLHLLAQGLSLPLEPAITVTAPPPPPMQAALRACGWEPSEP